MCQICFRNKFGAKNPTLDCTNMRYSDSLDFSSNKLTIVMGFLYMNRRSNACCLACRDRLKGELIVAWLDFQYWSTASRAAFPTSLRQLWRALPLWKKAQIIMCHQDSRKSPHHFENNRLICVLEDDARVYMLPYDLDHIRHFSICTKRIVGRSCPGI